MNEMKQSTIIIQNQPNQEDQFQSSKNQFLSTIFGSHRNQQHNINDQYLKSKTSHFIIQKQYLISYDPSTDPKTKIGLHQKLIQQRKNKFRAKSKNVNNSFVGNQKPFVEIHQAKNQQFQIEFKLFKDQKRKKVMSPGPGSYEISKSLVQPIYETIVKNDNTILVKMNGIEGTANFKSAEQKLIAIYDKQKMRNPGPGSYAVNTQQLRQKRDLRTKSKLQEYSKNHESNYKFLLEVLNSQHQMTTSMPNYTMISTSNVLRYNGKPQKLQRMTQKLDKSKQTHWKISNSKPSLSNYYSGQNITSQIDKDTSKLSEVSSIFPIKTVDQDKIKQIKQNKMNINCQFSETIKISQNNQSNSNLSTNLDNNLKQKLKLLIQTPINSKIKQKLNKRNHFYDRAGYYDGSQRGRLLIKYSQKAGKKLKILKKTLEPLPNRQKRFQSLNESPSFEMSNFLQEKKLQNRYDSNLIDLFLNKNTQTQKNYSILPNNKRSQKPSYSTIE